MFFNKKKEIIDGLEYNNEDRYFKINTDNIINSYHFLGLNNFMRFNGDEIYVKNIDKYNLYDLLLISIFERSKQFLISYKNKTKSIDDINIKFRFANLDNHLIIYFRENSFNVKFNKRNSNNKYDILFSDISKTIKNRLNIECKLIDGNYFFDISNEFFYKFLDIIKEFNFIHESFEMNLSEDGISRYSGNNSKEVMYTISLNKEFFLIEINEKEYKDNIVKDNFK